MIRAGAKRYLPNGLVRVVCGGPERGESRCPVSGCSRGLSAVGNPSASLSLAVCPRLRAGVRVYSGNAGAWLAFHLLKRGWQER